MKNLSLFNLDKVFFNTLLLNRICLFLIFILTPLYNYSQVTYPTSHSLDPYTGPWTIDEAKHLLFRTLYGPKLDQLDQAVTDGMDVAVDKILSTSNTFPFLPATYETNIDINIPSGETWVDKPYPVGSDIGAVVAARRRSLVGWKIELFLREDTNISQKMDLFWHNHFAVELSTADMRLPYQYFELIRKHSLGNFKQFIKDMTINTAMLAFLDGDENIKGNPNENYARELLELFSIGKGQDDGEEDFGRYNENDVREGAKILTGYEIIGTASTTIGVPYASFNSEKHDNSNKTLSHHFGSTTIAGNGATEYENYIDVIFSHPDFSSYICEAIYHFFVGNDITNNVKNNVIAGMASTLTNNDFEILPVMRQLLKSKHFYDVALRGGIIKSPVDFAFSAANPTDYIGNKTPAQDAKIYADFKNHIQSMGMNLSMPPTVFGWEAYYKGPNFSREWIIGNDILNRNNLANNLFRLGNEQIQLDNISFLKSLSDPGNINAVLDDFIKIYITNGLNPADRSNLYQILSGGWSPSQWQDNYNAILSGNPGLKDAVYKRIRFTLSALFKLNTFQTF